MRLVFVIGHPAHVHFFRNAIAELRDRGHEVFIAQIRKETTAELLEIYRMEYVTLGANVPNLLGKMLDLPLKDVRFVKYLHSTHPNMVVSVNSPYAAQACAVVSIPHIAFCDTEIATAIRSLTYPFSDAFVTPDSFSGTVGSRHYRYKGYKELAYLHPKHFSPDPSALKSIGATADECIIVVRLSSWNSSHDLAEHGMVHDVDDQVQSSIAQLESRGRVIVTSEREVPPRLRRFSVDLPLERVHDVLFYATLYLGEGATMASEAGVLGTPWVFVSREGRGFLDDQMKRYGLGYREATWDQGLARANALLSNRRLKAEWAERRTRMLEDKEDVTEFMVRFIESWPNVEQDASALTGSVRFDSKGESRAGERG